MDKPTPPPEAALLRRVRSASGMQAADAAAEVARRFRRKFSPSRWSQIENGYETRGGEYKRVTANAATLAQMFAVVGGVTPERLETQAGRPDAAEILGEILLGESAPLRPVPDPPSAPDPFGEPSEVAQRLFPGDRVKQWIWDGPGTDAEKAAAIAAIDQKRAELRGGSRHAGGSA